jgi:hypothetical protein
MTERMKKRTEGDERRIDKERNKEIRQKILEHKTQKRTFHILDQSH